MTRNGSIAGTAPCAKSTARWPPESSPSRGDRSTVAPPSYVREADVGAGRRSAVGVSCDRRWRTSLASIGRLAVAPRCRGRDALATASRRTHIRASRPASIEVGANAHGRPGSRTSARGATTVGFTLTFPPGFTVVEAEPSAAWTRARGRRVDASWGGGRISGADTVDFPLELSAVAPAGSYDVMLDQAYDDGRSVTHEDADHRAARRSARQRPDPARRPRDRRRGRRASWSSARPRSLGLGRPLPSAAGSPRTARAE